MEKVGIRELKNNLSKYLRDIRSGKSLVITDRQQSIALLEPIKTSPLKSIYPLLENGIASWNGGKPCGTSIKIEGSKTVSERVSEDRR
jgi:antitoxin (DNA-binding transcriptional repressor) of toxin-antitoxin stability system